jgi:RsiW-degrading membrane proteinase PrsW (M82 family)
MFDGSYQTMAQIFIGVSIIPVWFMLRNGRGKTEPHSELWRMVLFGVLAIFLTLAIAYPIDILFPQVSLVLDGKLGPSPPPNLLLATLLFATIEEMTKFIPAALYLYRKPHFNWRSDGILYFGLIGLTFGFIENMLYTASDGPVVGIVRIVFGLFFHGAVTAIAGYGLSYKKVTGKSWLYVLGGLLLASLLHTFYNYGLFVSAWQPLFVFLSIGITLAINSNFFIMFWRANKKDIAQYGSIETAQQHTAQTQQPVQVPQRVVTVAVPSQVIHAGAASGMSVASLVLGIVSIFSWIIPFFGLIPPILAIILGLSMLGKDPNGKSYNVAGSITGGIGLALSIFVHIFIVLLMVLGSTS